MKYFDILVIGGGAAGLCAAITAKRSDKNISVAVLEKLDRVGKKLITTGNGQCNITNKNMTVSHFHGEDDSFCAFSINADMLKKTRKLLEEIGIHIIYEPSGKAYPASYQAGSVVDCLRFALNECGAQLFLGSAVTDIRINNNMYEVITGDERFSAKAIILATGMLSGGERLGSDGSGIEIMKNLGYKVIKPTPSIVQIKTENTITKKLKGIKVDAKVSLFEGDTLHGSDYGEVLFTDYGLSGPPVMQLSRAVERAKKAVCIHLDLFSDVSFDTLKTMLDKRVELLSCRLCEEFLTGLINKRVGQAILKECDINLAQPISSLKNKTGEIAKKLKCLEFKVTGTTGFANSQVTAGGLCTRAFSDKTMQSLKHKGLFCAGEVLDIDGDCGGYNLQWAWSSGMLAGENAVKYVREQ